MFDLIIKNGMIVDGSGGEPYMGHVAVKNGKIARIISGMEKLPENIADRIFDVKGENVTPGFIDIHRHADGAVFRENFGNLELRQGITTLVNGNCGLSVVPCPVERRKEILDFLQPVLGEIPDEVRLTSFKEYMDDMKKCSLPVNVGMLIGNGTVCAASAGYGMEKLDSEQEKCARQYLEQAFRDGALGVSLGMSYAPECHYDTQSLKKILMPMTGMDFQLITHVRGEGDQLVESVREVLNIAKALRVPLHISHLKAIGRRNWHCAIAEVFQLMEHAREEGQDISCDFYPYTAGSTQLLQVFPPSCLNSGTDGLIKNLKKRTYRDELTKCLQSESRYFDNIAGLVGWENIYLTTLQTEKNKQYEGMSAEQIANLLHKDVYECIYDLLIEEKCGISMIDFIAAEDDIEMIMKHPYSNVISDSIYPSGGKPHPRLYGTFTRVLEHYVKEKQVISLQEAIMKMTSMPARVCKIKNKGLVREGMDADLLVFNLDKIRSKAVYSNPTLKSEGFTYIFVNGCMALKEDTVLEKRFGRTI